MLRRARRYLLARGRLTSENQCRCADHIYTASNTYSDFNASAYGHSDADAHTHTHCHYNAHPNTRPSDCHY